MGCQCMSTSKPIRCDEKRAWGPLHTRAKSGDNEIVRAQKKCLKAISRHFQIQVLWWWTLKCSVKSYVIGCSTKCYFNGFSIHVRSSHKIQYSNPKVVRFWSAMVSEYCVRPTKWPWNMIPLMLCKTSCGPNIHLAFTYSVGPSNVVWSELGPAQPFPTNESAWSAMVTGLQSRVWSGPENAVQCTQYYFLGHHCCKFGSKKPVDVMIRMNHTVCQWFSYIVCRIIQQADMEYIYFYIISPFDEKNAWECNGTSDRGDFWA